MCNQCCSNNTAIQEDFVVYGNQFTTNNEYQNQFLQGKRFRLEMRGLGKLVRKTEWSYVDEGGFKISITANWTVTPDVVIIGEFY